MMKKHGECFILIMEEPRGWHMSISHPSRYPKWDEIKHAWYEFVPGAKTMMGAMYFPPEDEFINLHCNCFHIYEVKEKE